MAPDRSRKQPTVASETLSWRARRWWRARLRPAWRAAHPWLVIFLALAVVFMGTVGYQQTDDRLSTSDALYRAIQLFGLSGGDAPANAPLLLDIARFLAPLLVGYAAVRGLMALSRQQLRLLFFRFRLRDHLIVAGIGDVGFRLAASLNEEGARVIAIDKDPANPSLPGCRERGIAVLVGDATDEQFLRAARVQAARHLIVTCGSDATNLDVAAAAKSLAGKRTGDGLAAFAHIEDRALWRALGAAGVTEGSSRSFRLEPFNVYGEAIRRMLSEHPPFSPTPGRPQILLVTDTTSTAPIVLEIARRVTLDSSPDPTRPRAVIASPDAERQRSRLLAEHPGLAELCELAAAEEGPTTPARSLLTLAHEADLIYVALVDEAKGAATALRLGATVDRTVKLVLAVNDEEAGIAGMISSYETVSARIEVFGLLSRTLRHDFLLGGLNNALAQAMHGVYLQMMRARAPSERELPSLVPWHELPESVRQSNRRFADGIGEKLREMGWVAVPAAMAADGRAVELDADDLEELAQMEHERWKRDLTDDGWSRGSVNDPEGKTHPLLVPWEQLGESDRDKDREAVRQLPGMLARTGYEIRRAGR